MDVARADWKVVNDRAEALQAAEAAHEAAKKRAKDAVRPCFPAWLCSPAAAPVWQSFCS